jgi:hypothetical protein
MKTKSSTYALRLPVSLKLAVAKLSKEDGFSMNQFVVTAVAEKVSAINTADYLAERASHADMAAFDRIMKRAGGAAPSEQDRLD